MFCSGFHEVPGQKIGQPDFPNGGDAVGEQKYAYERDGDDRHQRREHKQDLHKTFSEFFHKTSGFGGYSYPPNIPLFLYSSSALQVVSSPM